MWDGLLPSDPRGRSERGKSGSNSGGGWGALCTR
jgi:hypothetical protein